MALLRARARASGYPGGKKRAGFVHCYETSIHVRRELLFGRIMVFQLV